MQPRLDVRTVSPGARNALGSLVVFVNKSGLESSLVDLISLRASIHNKCAYCIDAHTKDARLRGETEQRLYAVTAWEPTPFFTERERAALAWTDMVCDLHANHISDDAYNHAREYFSEKELVDLTMAVIAVNAWSTLATTFRFVPGSYQPAQVEKIHQELEKLVGAQP